MVLSKIDPLISYKERKSIEDADSGEEADLFQLELHDILCIVAIGHQKKKETITYFPLYLIKHNNKAVQIGVFEFKSTDLDPVLQTFDLDKADEPLLYSFATREFIDKMHLIVEEEDKAEEKAVEIEKPLDIDSFLDEEPVSEDNKINQIRADIFILNKGVPLKPRLKEETQKKAKSIREKYHEQPSDLWINKFMKNPHFLLQDNEGDGDCFFATIRDAFASIGQTTTTAKLRKKLAEEATQEVFDGYKELYDNYQSSLVKDTAKIQELAAEYADFKRKFTEVIDRAEQKVYALKAKEIKAEHDQLIVDKKLTATLLKEYKFMKNVDNLDQFRAAIKKCTFWADTWAISTFERILNIKIIILSSEMYAGKDDKNVMQCGQLNDAIIGRFTPDYYIMVDYTGNHYKLIGYRGRFIFKFKEIPFDVKRLISEKCLERNSGLFALIPDFQEFKFEKKGNKIVSSASNKNAAEERYEDLSEAKLRGLYDDSLTLQFYSKSLPKPVPGKGAGESVPKDRMKEFSKLASFVDWRKKLSDSFVQPFSLDDHSWSSVEHYYQASKFKNGFPDFYLSFSRDSGTELSKDPALARIAGIEGKSKATGRLRPLEVSFDPAFNPGKEKYAATYAKFTQNDDLKDLLLATNEAKLMHYIKDDKPEVANELMMVRAKIRNNR